MRRAALLALLVLGSIVPVVSDAELLSQDQAVPAPVFRTGVELVRLDVNAVDGEGRPVPDLRADEVEVFENGVRRPVLLFQRVQQPVGSYADVARRTIASEVSTNQGAPRGHVYVLVFDQSHITAGNEQRARQAAQRFLRSAMRAGDRVAVYGLPGPGPQIEFTGDASRAIRGLDLVRGSRDDNSSAAFGPMRIYDAYEITRGNQEILQRYVDRALQPVASSDTVVLERPSRVAAEDPVVVRRLLVEDARVVVNRADSESRQFLQILAEVIRSLRDVDGRKSVILFSEGFEIDNVRHELEAVAGAAAQTYCVVYSLDLNPRFQDLSQMEPRTVSLGTEILSRLESIGSLASETSGELIIDARGQLDGALSRIAGSSQDYYLVGFEPLSSGGQNPAAYHRVSVRATRPGVRTLTRSGYSVGPSLAATDPRRAIDAALRAPFSQQNIKLEYTTYVLGGSSFDMQRVVMSMAAELPVVSGDARAADVVFAVRNVDTGALVATGSDRLPLPDVPRPGAAAGTGYFRVQFEAPPGVYLMRVVVREPGGLLGSADRRFRVRALGGPGVAAGDMILGSVETSGLPVRALAVAGEVLSGVFEVYGRSASQLNDVAADVQLFPFGSSSATTSGRAALDAVSAAKSGVSRTARIELPLGGVDPGEYVVRAIVRSGGETVGELTRDVTILGARPAAVSRPSADAVEATAVLQGDVARRVVAAIHARSADSPLAAAAAFAREGRWTDVGPALPGGQPVVSDALVLSGLARLAVADYAAAAALLGTAFDADMAQAPVAFLLGWARAGAGDDTGALGAWRAAVHADPAMVPGYLALIDGYLRLGRPDLALQVARSGSAAVPASPELRDRLARLERR
jgi:VWFA-related protein